MKFLLYCWVLICPVTLLAAEPAAVQLPDREKFYLFLLAGQSNMAGRGEVAEEDRRVHPRLLMLDKEGNWQPATEPLHFDKPKVIGVGPGKAFGVTLLEELPEDVTIGLVPCAVGGTSIVSWEPGGYDKSTNTHPYDDMLKRCQLAAKSGVFKGVLWHQGEGDSGPGRAEEYETRLHQLIERLRSEFANPQLPFVAGQLGQFEGIKWSAGRKKVNQAHQQLPEKVPHTGFAPSDKLVHKGDKVHFDAESSRELGRRFARKYLELVSDKP